MNRRRKPDPDLFGDVPPVQPRYQTPEPPRVYEAVIRARFRGFQVYRAGRDKHLIRARTGTQGRKVTTAVLLELFLPKPRETIG